MKQRASVPVAVTGGDCAGIGPEIAARAMAAFPEEQFVLFTNRALFCRACAAAGVAVPANVHWHEVALGCAPEAVVPGQNQAVTGEVAYQSVVAAGEAALRGEVRGVVTAPFSKAALHLAGHTDVPGHTELLARLCGREEATMAFFSPKLVVSLVTIHCALREVPERITPARLARVLRDTAGALSRVVGRRPRIGVMALNPHAGEGGAFGDEEARVIVPTMAACADAAEFVGPLVPDTALLTEGLDGFVAMYHDQGLIPFKAVAFRDGVNVTLGLPILRTSPDHGTAFNLAWQGRASAESMVSAIALLQRLAAERCRG
ncbi:MAG: 4-hydroxythreonine-4-phosphate dehydrogenase PdxA [Candidatus Spyradenecus sp.]